MEQFLKRFYTNERANHTHTKIKCEKLNISGGSYNIPEEEIDNFYKVYKQHIFDEGKQAYLTEKKLVEGQILIDVDFKYSVEIDTRQHTKNHIIDLINSRELFIVLISIISNLLL